MICETRPIDQSKLTEECWILQLQGFTACLNCPYRNTPECGGEEIMKTGKNKRGHKVPI